MPTPMYRVDPVLMDPRFATERQLEILKAIDQYRSLREASRQLKINFNTVRQALHQVEKKAAIYGYAPKHDLTHVAAPGYAPKGHSTLYKEGQPILQWVKTTRDEQKIQEIIQASIEALKDEVPRVNKCIEPSSSAPDLCNVITLTDCHVGMHSWGRQTGADWDLEIAEATLTAAFMHLVNAAPKADTCVVAQLGDYLHFDSLEPVTPTSKHLVDADSRYSKVIKVAVRTLRAICNMALVKHKNVVVVIAEGNHDMAGSVWLKQMFELLYENEPRLTVVDSEIPYYAHQHGSTMLAWHHGHLKNKNGLPLLFAAQYPKIWGDTTKRYIHTGHQHHVDEKEHAGAKVVQHPTMAARDAYAARGGWISERQMACISYHTAYGEVARTLATPEMFTRNQTK